MMIRRICSPRFERCSSSRARARAHSQIVKDLLGGTNRYRGNGTIYSAQQRGASVRDCVNMLLRHKTNSALFRKSAPPAQNSGCHCVAGKFRRALSPSRPSARNIQKNKITSEEHEPLHVYLYFVIDRHSSICRDPYPSTIIDRQAPCISPSKPHVPNAIALLSSVNATMLEWYC